VASPPRPRPSGCRRRRGAVRLGQVTGGAGAREGAGRPGPPLGGTLQKEGRIPFDPHTDFDRISERALQFAPRAFGYGDVLRLMRGAKRTGTAKDRMGATYEQLARIAYLLGIDKHERNARKMWYRIARDVMLSEAHADHIIVGLKAAGNPNREVSQ
jgi:hypothetical protein